MPASASVRRRGLAHVSRLRLVAVAAGALLLGLALASFPPGHSAAPSPDGALTAPSRPGPAARTAAPDARLPVDLYRFALNAFLLSLLDDAEPPRWTDAAIDFSCEPGTSVLVDGVPMVAGKLMPATAFTVRWNMNRCTFLGTATELSGRVELSVFHEDAGLGAIVMPERLRVDSPMGQTWLRGPFTAETLLAVAPVRP